jgi:hypothetical protein
MRLTAEEEQLIQKQVPDNTCARCGRRFKVGDRITFVFIMIDPDARNPTRPTEMGLSLGTDCEFMHCDCARPALGATSASPPSAPRRRSAGRAE